MALSNNGIVSIFSRSIPEFGGIQFDAQLRHQFQSTSRITGYQTETGATINNHIVFDPTSIEMELAVGTAPLFSWGGLASQSILGFVSNFASSALVARILGAISTIVSGSGTRGGEVLESLVGLQVSGVELDLEVPHVAFFPRMIIVDIQHSRSPDTGQGDMFVVRFQQRRNSATSQGTTILRSAADIKELQLKGAAPVTDITTGS